MNAVEHIVETYYRLVEKCYTISDIKVLKGNNRQFDILAYSPRIKNFYHVELSVTHCKNWCASLDEIEQEVACKFFGKVKNNRPENPNTDFAKGKRYLEQIKMTYDLYGINFSKLIRVWCAWYFEENNEEMTKWRKKLAIKYKLTPQNFELLSFRDEVIPKLKMEIGTSNYDDEILRTLSLLFQYEKQLV